MAYEIRPDDPNAWLNGYCAFYRLETLLELAVNGSPMPRQRQYAIAECTICGDPYERHGEFDPAEVNRLPRCRCCKATTTVPVRVVMRMVRSLVSD